MYALVWDGEALQDLMVRITSAMKDDVLIGLTVLVKGSSI